MNYIELKEKFNELESLNQATVITQDMVADISEGLEALKESFMSSYFEFEKIEDYQELENIKIKISENILLCKISRNAFLGISVRDFERELDGFYNTNGKLD